MRAVIRSYFRPRMGPPRASVLSAPARLARAVLESLEHRKLLSTFYVSASGNDLSSGTLQHPWKTISRVNQQTLHAGDKVLFQAGKTFSGSIVVKSNEGGTQSNPVVFSSYGIGRAVIKSGKSAGIDVQNTAGVLIKKLNLVGSGAASNTSSGINFHLDSYNLKKSGLYIVDVDASGYGRDGIEIHANGPAGSSLSNVKIENVNVHDNLLDGLKSTSNQHNINKNWVIRRVRAWNNTGSKSAGGVTGSGIYIADVNSALIERCVAWNNGKNGKAPVGIWVAGSNRVILQYNESFSNYTASGTDGGGFDLDWDVNNSTLQYNYSHSNDGPGYQLCAASHGGDSNIVRYNISENDGRKNGKSGIQLWGNVTNALVYNNTIYTSASGNSYTAAFTAAEDSSTGKVPTNVEVRNNIFLTTNGQRVIYFTNTASLHAKVRFVANAYYSFGGGTKIQWGKTQYTTLSNWRSAKGQENFNGFATGYIGDPKLKNAGHGGTLANADILTRLGAYKLQGNSPLINKGQSQPSVLLSVVTKDFFGDQALLGGRYDIGAAEAS